MNRFKVISNLKPKGDQPKAIEQLVGGINKNLGHQTLLGVTGSGKTFTMAKVIETVQKPTLIISHNKTLAAQLFQEFQDFFPKNSVHYFVSYYDYYQPEAYIPQTDVYIEKDASINEEIARLRYASTASLMTRKDTLIVASVSSIYGIGEPEEYLLQSLSIKKNQVFNRQEFLKKLVFMQYERTNLDFKQGNFRVRGEVVEIFPSYEKQALRMEFDYQKIKKISEIDPLNNKALGQVAEITIFPAKHFVTSKEKLLHAIEAIKIDLAKQVHFLKSQGKELEAKRLESRTNFDIEMMLETGYCHGIENYSLYLSDRNPGDPPHTLIHYFPKDFLIFIDESHITLPQVRGMYRGDKSRKETLIEHGFRLPSALDNRPLRFEEFGKLINQAVYVSATPGDYEVKLSSKDKVKNTPQFFNQRFKGKEIEGIAEQVIRPTGLLDPVLEVRSADNQMDDLLGEIQKRAKKNQRILVTTLTKRMAEDLTDYLLDLGVKVQYLHSDIETLERPEILRDLRLGIYDVVVGINLLREGLDIPEVSLVAILDADKEGFLRSDVSLIQTIGRASRHKEGTVIMYADQVTGSMKRAIQETNRRREVQLRYNQEHHITPKTIEKEIRQGLKKEKLEIKKEIIFQEIPGEELNFLIKDLDEKMHSAASNLEFEKAAYYRDQIKKAKEEFEKRALEKQLKKIL